MIIGIIYCIINKLFEILNYSISFETKTGVKALNVKKMRKSYKWVVIGEKLASIDQIFLGFDCLSDEHTLVDTPIMQSPHYELMKSIVNKSRICDTDYICRLKKGTLDERLPKFVTKRDISNILEKFYERLKQAIDDSYVSISVYEIHNRTYILDGKHRAAMLALLNKQVRCKVYDRSFLLEEISRKNGIYIMKNNTGKYKRNLRIIK